MGKKWIYWESSTPYERCGAISEDKTDLGRDRVKGPWRLVLWLAYSFFFFFWGRGRDYQELGHHFLTFYDSLVSFPSGSTGKESACQHRRPGFNPWFGKIPWRKEWLPTPVFWPREFHGLNSQWRHKESDATFTFTLGLLQPLRVYHLAC